MPQPTLAVTPAAQLSRNAPTPERARGYSDFSQAAAVLSLVDARVAGGSPEAINQGLRYLQAWSATLQRAGFVRVDAGYVMRVSPAASQRFALGSYGGRLFLGVQPEEMRWMLALPWRYIAASQGSSALTLVPSLAREGTTTPAFAVSIESGLADLFECVTSAYFLDVRPVSPDENGKLRVTGAAVMALDVAITEGDEGIDALLRLRGRCYTTGPVRPGRHA